jgi:hypothetical protein
MFTDLFDDKPKEEIEISADADPMQFLRAIYLNNGLPLSQRMRAAIELLPFLHPKLQATAIVSEGSFAELLERRLKRVAEAKLIEHKPQEIETRQPTAHTVDRRFRRI